MRFRQVVGLACVALVAAAGLLDGGASATGVMYLVPLLALLVPLAAGRFPGERTLLRIGHGRRVRRSAPRPVGEVRVHRAPSRLLPRGGRLIASALAVRPPPANTAAPRLA
jgi:hypothetical protein